NVMVDERGRLLLADWGIAHGLAADRTSTQTQLIGNRGFSLPPEMLAGDPSVGRYTDGWYLGSLLAWMLTGQPPGPQHGETWLPPGIPDNPSGQRVSAVIQGLCWPDPRQRMALPQAFEHLSDVTAGRPSRLPAPTTMPVTLPVTADPGTTQVMTGTGPTHVFAPPTLPPQAPARRSWATAAVVAAAVVIVVLVAALVWTSGLVGSGGDPSTADPGAGGGSQPSVAASDLCWTDDDTVPCPAYKPGEAVLNTFLLDEERTGLPLPACEARYEMIVPETFYYLLCGWDEDQAGCPEDEWECGMIRLRYFDDMDTMRGYLSWAGYEESPSTPGLRPHDDKGTPVAATVYVLDDPDELFAVAYCYDAFPFCMDIQSNDKDAVAAIADRFVTAPDSYVQQLTAYLEAHPV
ncbi:MAG: hypothetical protein FWD11_09640, partial [Micrococcales bacterium]|nr:hypothetical protein [Micrococcales bacterium]